MTGSERSVKVKFYTLPHGRLTTDDLTKQFLWGVSKEGGAAHQELVQDHPHGPPVHRFAVALTQYHLWGDVLRSTTHLQGRGWGLGGLRNVEQGLVHSVSLTQSPHLFVQEFSGVFLDVSFIQVCGQTHQTDLRETKVGQFDVTHGGDEETGGAEKERVAQL